MRVQVGPAGRRVVTRMTAGSAEGGADWLRLSIQLGGALADSEARGRAARYLHEQGDGDPFPHKPHCSADSAADRAPLRRFAAAETCSTSARRRPADMQANAGGAAPARAAA